LNIRLMKRSLLVTCLFGTALSGNRAKYCTERVCNHCWSYLLRVMNPLGDKHFVRCSILTANKDCCSSKSNSVHSNVFTVKNPDCDGKPDSTLVKAKTIELTIEGCSSSSRTINTTPELQDHEIPNDISTLMNVFDPTELDVCSGNECISLNSPNVQVQQNEKTCRVTYEEWETCAEVTKTHNTDQLKQGLVYTMIALIGSLVTLTFVWVIFWLRRDRVKLEKANSERRKSMGKSISPNNSPKNISKFTSVSEKTPLKNESSNSSKS